MAHQSGRRDKGAPELTKRTPVAGLVRELRARLGLTQEKMAVRLGVTFPTINRWENGRAKPSPLALKQIEDLLATLGNDGEKLRSRYLSKKAI